jgi:hypothetical protein
MFNLAGAAFLAEQPDEDARLAWRWIAERVRPYPQDTFIPPMRPPDRNPVARRIIAAEIEHDGGTDSLDPWPTRLRLFDGEHEGRVQLEGRAVDASRLEGFLLNRRNRGAYVVFWNGGRLGFHLLLRHYWRPLIRRGYRLRPLLAGGEIKAVLISRHRHTWTLCDAQATTGVYECCRRCFIRALAGPAASGAPGLWPIWQAMTRFQSLLMERFNVPLCVTLGMASVRAASRYIPDDAWLWRPPPGLVAVCRAGGGYRGGFVYARPYRGPAHKIDLTKLYTWALSQPLPVRTAVGECEYEGNERPGVYLCRVAGPGYLPVLLSVWRGPDRGFVRQLWSGDACTTVLPQSEFYGLRALGYDVTPGWGYVFTRTFDLAHYVAQLEELCREHPRGTLQHTVGKKLGNSLSGKFGEHPDRTEIVYAEAAPSRAWHPFITDEGEEIAGLWTHGVTRYRSHQQVGIAAEITALGRSRLYDALAQVVNAGGEVYAADTDGAIISDVPTGLLSGGTVVAGAWRHVGYEEDTIIARPKLYAFGKSAAAAGITGATREVVEAAYVHGSVVVAGKRLAPAYTTGAMRERYDQRVTLVRRTP